MFTDPVLIQLSIESLSPQSFQLKTGGDNKAILIQQSNHFSTVFWTNVSQPFVSQVPLLSHLKLVPLLQVK